VFKKSNLILFLLIILIFKDSSAQFQATSASYIESLISERNEKDEYYRTDKSSPLDSLSKISFSGLNYFKPSTKWVIKARIERYSTSDTIQMKTTTERLPLYIVYGKASFSLQGKVYELTIFRNVDLMNKPGYENYMFVPFTDKTSGQETYGGGRYVDAYIDQSQYISIDFNKAYNPYCVYNKKYSCPIPPSENYLPVKVKAGEKNYQPKLSNKK